MMMLLVIVALPIAMAESNLINDEKEMIGSLNQPYGITLDKRGTLYVADNFNNEIKVYQDGKWTLFAGGEQGIGKDGLPVVGYVDGKADEARFNRPRGIAFGPDGALYVADTGNQVIRVIKEGMVSTFTGSGDVGHSDSFASLASFNTPSGIAFGPDGNLYVADTLNNLIRVVDSKGKVSSLKWTGSSMITTLNEPTDVTFDAVGDLYIVDSGNHQIKKVHEGVISLVAGIHVGSTDSYGYYEGGNADGSALVARFNFPKAMTFDSHGNAFIADTWNNSIRVLKKDGQVVTYLDESFDLDNPIGVLALNDTLYVVDRWNHKVRAFKIDYGIDSLQNDQAYFKKLLPLSLDLESHEDYSLYDGDGKVISIDTAIMEDEVNGLSLPLKSIATYLGYEVKWNTLLNQVELTKEDEFKAINQDNGLMLDHGKSYLEQSVMEKELGVTFDWSRDLKVVILNQ